MECQVDVACRLGCPSQGHEGPWAGRVDKALLEELGDVLDSLGGRSAVARELQTKYDDRRLPLVRSTEDTVYLLAEGRDVLGFARVGIRTIMAVPPSAGSTAPSDGRTGGGGYDAFRASLQKLSPCALLDFYVLDGFQRRGLGRLLFDAVLRGEGAQHPAKFAYSHPSEGLSAFLKKHFGLTTSRQASSYMLFDAYFDETPAAPPLAPLAAVFAQPSSSASNTAKGGKTEAAAEKGSCCDPIGPYRKDEEEFYSQRTKLYCYNADEWQDAGAGSATLMRNTATGRVRFIFVQEASNQVIANHFLVNRAPLCELQRHTAGNDKTWTWTALERVVERKFALKFKTSDDAAKFKELFDTVKQLSAEEEAIDYVVVRKVGATAESDVNSRHLKLVSVGTVVKVVEVLYLAEQKRVRGRLVNPLGWITIMSHNAADTANYAVRSSDMECYEAAKALPASPA